MKRFFITAAMGIVLSACADLPSPQDTTPTQEAQCKAMQSQMMQTGSQNNTANAVLDSEQQTAQQAYKDQCE